MRSSEEAHGARKPPINEGMPDSKSVVASVLSPVISMKRIRYHGGIFWFILVFISPPPIVIHT